MIVYFWVVSVSFCLSNVGLIRERASKIVVGLCCVLGLLCLYVVVFQCFAFHFARVGILKKNACFFSVLWGFVSWVIVRRDAIL